jgi:hypothetical protein
MLNNVKSVWRTHYCIAATEIGVSNNSDSEVPRRHKRQRSPDEIDRYLQAMYTDTNLGAASNDGFNIYVASGRLNTDEVTNSIA